MSGYYRIIFIIVLTLISCSDDSSAAQEPDGRRSQHRQPPPVAVEGGISGPISVYEEETAVFKIDGDVPENAAILWTV
ncbi:MAG: hypothetical protein ABIC40_04075, partial [bacterium]